MSNATLAVYGRLGSDPREHETRKGGAMATASLAVNVPDRSQGAEDGATETLWFNVVAFGRVAESLAQHAKGDPVSVSGRLQWSRWTDRDGDEREQWQVLADALVSARTVRPGGGRRKSKGDGNGRDRDDVRSRGEGAGWPGVTEPAPASSSPSSAPADFDDDIPF